METHQREKEKPWFQVNCKKKQLPRDTRSKPGQQAEKYAQLGFRHHKHAWPEPLQNQTRPGQKWKRKRQTATNRTSPLEAVLCCLSNHVSFRGGGRSAPLPPLFCKTPALLRAPPPGVVGLVVIGCLRKPLSHTFRNKTEKAPLEPFCVVCLKILKHCCQREKEKPWFQVNCKKKTSQCDTHSKPGQQAEKYEQLRLRHHKHAWPEPSQNQKRRGQE